MLERHRVLNRHGQLEFRAAIDLAVALHHVKSGRVAAPLIVDERAVVQPDCVNDERVAFPMPHGVTEVAGRGTFGMGTIAPDPPGVVRHLVEKGLSSRSLYDLD